MLRINKKQLQFFFKAGRAKIVFVDGMPRSGSTLVFNAMRLVLQADPACDLQSSWVRNARHLPRANTYLIKTHGMNLIDAWRASKIVYSYRDPRVALVSHSRKFGTTPSIEMVHQWMRDFNFAEQHAGLMFGYEDMVKDVPAVVHALADYAGCEVDSAEIADNVNLLVRQGDDQSEAVTLLHGSHRTGTKDDEWRLFLPQALQTQITNEYSPWLERHGYPLR